MARVNEAPAQPMTQEQHDVLVRELAALEGPGRQEAIQTIAETRSEGDLSENFGYHDAKNAQGLLERRISILRDRLERAEIVSASEETVGVGSRVAIEDESGERMEFEISGNGGQGTVSTSSPLGAALYGHRVGDVIEVKAPRGSWAATIVALDVA